MCGFVVASTGSFETLPDTRSMVDQLTHRGPDEQGTWNHDQRNVEFSQCRLSIIDLPKGSQPMQRGGTSLVYNGELYNFKSLRNQLETEYDFRTESDTEVFLQGYREWGTSVFEKARGMFSAVIWDESEQRMVLVRDPLGQKPLVYFSKDNKFMAASELQGLVTSNTISSKIDPASLSWYLSLGYVPSPRTGFFDVKKLPPGHYMTVQDTQIQSQVRYWDPVNLTGGSDVQPGEVTDRIRTRVDQAVKRRLVSDVPLGAFLSGGIDSSIVVGLMSEQMDRPVKTVSVGFERSSHDERNYARLAAEAYNTDHTEYTLRTELEDLLPDLVRHFGEPFADSSAVPTYYLARKTRDHVKVALSGDGGDEAFGGYRRYRAFRYLHRINGWLPLLFRKLVQNAASGIGFPSRKRSRWGELLRIAQVLGEHPVKQYLSMAGLGYDDLKRRIAREKLEKPAQRGGEQWLERWFRRFDHVDDPAQLAMFVDVMSYLPEDLLVKTDVTTMMNSLECRSPFLDRDVVELAFRIPAERKIEGTNHKACLKEAFGELLPPEIRNRGKMGFGVPLAEWFREGDRAKYLGSILKTTQSEFHRLIDRESVIQLLESHRDQRIDAAPLLWALVCMKLWIREFDARV